MAPHSAKSCRPGPQPDSAKDPNSQDSWAPHQNKNNEKLAKKFGEINSLLFVTTNFVKYLLAIHHLNDHSDNEEKRDARESSDVHEPKENHGT